MIANQLRNCKADGLIAGREVGQQDRGVGRLTVPVSPGAIAPNRGDHAVF